MYFLYIELILIGEKKQTRYLWPEKKFKDSKIKFVCYFFLELQRH